MRERELRDDAPRTCCGAAGVKPLVPARRSGVAAVAAGTPASPKMRCCAVCTASAADRRSRTSFSVSLPGQG